MKIEEASRLYQERDQGTAMLLAASSWLCYLVLVSIADYAPSHSLVSALTRLGSLLSFFIAVVFFNGAFPRTYALVKRLAMIFAIIGMGLQFMAVATQMKACPDIPHFLDLYYLGQFSYSLAIFPFTYLLLKCPRFPRWLAITFGIDGIFWVIYYIASVNKWCYLLMEALAWGPSLLVEVTVGIYFVITGNRMRQAAPKRTTEA